MEHRSSESIPSPRDGEFEIGTATRLLAKQLGRLKLGGLKLGDDPRLSWAQTASASSDYGGSWSASQATGPPKVFPRHGDHPGAWAQAGRSVGIATLDLSFAPSAREVHGLLVLETLGPGAVFAITAGPSASDELLFYAKAEQLSGHARALHVEFDQPRELTQVRLWLDTDAGSASYNEIDAVALVHEPLGLGTAHSDTEHSDTEHSDTEHSDTERSDGGRPMANVYEMFWDCEFCGETKLLGKTHRSCPKCGAPQDPTRRYFPEESEKVAVANHIYYGRDLVCEHCKTPNSAAAKHCVGCGAPIGDGDSPAALIEWQTRRAQQEQQLQRRETKRKLLGSAFFKTRRARVLTAIASLVLLATLATLVTLFWTRTAATEVIGHHWSRSIAIERFQATSEGSWCDSTPSDAYGISRSTRQRGTNEIPDGQECSTVNVDNGDGTYRQEQSCQTRYRSEPIYDDWCDYTVDRWVHQFYETAAGEGRTPPPHWPSISVSGCASLGCTREGGHLSAYTVRYVELGVEPAEVLECDLEQDAWAASEVGSQWTCEIRVITGGLVCRSLTPKAD